MRSWRRPGQQHAHARRQRPLRAPSRQADNELGRIPMRPGTSNAMSVGAIPLRARALVGGRRREAFEVDEVVNDPTLSAERARSRLLAAHPPSWRARTPCAARSGARSADPAGAAPVASTSRRRHRHAPRRHAPQKPAVSRQVCRSGCSLRSTCTAGQTRPGIRPTSSTCACPAAGSPRSGPAHRTRTSPVRTAPAAAGSAPAADALPPLVSGSG